MAILAEFDGYVLREVNDGDADLLEDWIVRDSYHRGRMGKNFFLGEREDGSADPRAQCYAIEDGSGEIFFIRLSRAARVNIQFGPSATSVAKERNRQALLRGMAFFEALMEPAGTEEWIFQTSNPELKISALRRLGFQASPQELVRSIPYPQGKEERGGALHPEQLIEESVREVA